MTYKLLTLAVLCGWFCVRSVRNGESRLAFLSAMATIGAVGGAL